MARLRILSIDGGGIRGVIPGVILTYIEMELQKREGKDVRLADYFDLIAGTSTGGILTCAYLVPGDNNRPKYTAEEAVNFYFERGGKIFDVSFWQALRTQGGLSDEKYSAKELEKALNYYFGDITLSQLIKPCMITAYDILNRRAMFFNSADAKSPTKDFYIKHVCRATSAAPTYFEVAKVPSLYGTTYPLVDGGMFANNPAMCAYSEARTMDFGKHLDKKSSPKHPQADDMFLLSIGTGGNPHKYDYEKAKDWGLVSWIKPIIDIMMSSNSETVDYHLKQLFDTTNAPDNYIRIEPDLYNASPNLDDASDDNLKNLREAGLQYIANNTEQLNKIVDKLIENK